jgi:hypothetical protein
MNTKERVREWVLDRSKNLHIKSFKPVALTKQFDITMREAGRYCTQLMIEGIIDPLYCYHCDCGHIVTCTDVDDIPYECELCEEETDLSKVYIEFTFKR